MRVPLPWRAKTGSANRLPASSRPFRTLDALDDGSTDPQQGAFGDPDADGLDNLGEAAALADPLDPDSDSDTLVDGVEVLVHGTDPILHDSDGDGLIDGFEELIGSDVLNPDSDGDGVSNGREIADCTGPG